MQHQCIFTIIIVKAYHLVTNLRTRLIIFKLSNHISTFAIVMRMGS